jgi:hypothetical protein
MPTACLHIQLLQTEAVCKEPLVNGRVRNILVVLLSVFSIGTKILDTCVLLTKISGDHICTVDLRKAGYSNCYYYFYRTERNCVTVEELNSVLKRPKQ